MNIKQGIFLLILAIFPGCGKDNIAKEGDFKKSLSAWKTFKSESGNSYTYTVTGSSWVGSSWETRLTVEDGKISGRTFRYLKYGTVSRPATGWDTQSMQEILDDLKVSAAGFEKNMGWKLSEILEWQEDKTTLGSHPGGGSPAAALLSLDEVYHMAETDWLKRRNNAMVYFETKNEGMISVCGYVENGCSDDCFRGIVISAIGLL